MSGAVGDIVDDVRSCVASRRAAIRRTKTREAGGRSMGLVLFVKFLVAERSLVPRVLRQQKHLQFYATADLRNQNCTFDKN